jgi:hypothetical protein
MFERIYPRFEPFTKRQDHTHSCGTQILTITEDPKALAGDVYNRCFSKNLKNYEQAITDQLEEVIKALRNAFS